MDALLKRREELIRKKEQIQTKLEHVSNTSRLSQRNVVPQVQDMKWDSKNDRLGVLHSEQLSLRCSSEGESIKIINLPIRSTDLALILNDGLTCITSEELNEAYILQNDLWIRIDSLNSRRLIMVTKPNIRVVLDDSRNKRIQIMDCIMTNNCFELENVLEVSNVTRIIHESTESQFILLLKADSLSLLNISTLQKLEFPFKMPLKLELIYFNYKVQDSTLFLVQLDSGKCRLKILVGGTDEGNFFEISSIPIPKEIIWLKVSNPFIMYQDAKFCLHVRSLFTLMEEGRHALSSKIKCFCIMNECGKNMILLKTVSSDEFILLDDF